MYVCSLYMHVDLHDACLFDSVLLTLPRNNGDPFRLAHRPNRFESRLARGDSDITIVTQCSLSRLGRLQHMCSLWTGVVSVAVIAERGGRVDRRMKRIAGALHNSVESGDKCRLDMCLCQFASSRVATDVLYPANALRNAAVAQAKTELIFLLVRKVRV